MATVDVDMDGCSLLADSQPKLVDLVCAIWRSVCIHQMNRVNSHSGHGHEDSTINVILITGITKPHRSTMQMRPIVEMEQYGPSVSLPRSRAQQK